MSLSNSTVEDWEVLDLLTRLVDKSLVVYDAKEERYRLLETVRQYASERMFDQDDAAAFRERHLDHFAGFAKEIDKQWNSASQRRCLDLLEVEYVNLRAALDFSLGAPEGVEAGLTMCEALYWFWVNRGQVHEGRQWIAAALEQTEASGPSLKRIWGVQWAGNLAYIQGDYAAARRWYEEGAAMCRQTDNRRLLAGLLGSLGNVTQFQGNLAEARALFEQSLEINREIGNRQWEAANLTCLGSVARHQGDDSAAHSYLEQALTLYRAQGDRSGEAITLNYLGSVIARLGNAARGQSLVEQALQINWEIGDQREAATVLGTLAKLALDKGDYARAQSLYAESTTLHLQFGARDRIADLLLGFASLAFQQRHPERAATLCGAAQTLREAIGYSIPPIDRENYAHLLADCRAALGEAAFQAAFQAGRALSWEEAVTMVSQSPPTPSAVR